MGRVKCLLRHSALHLIHCPPAASVYMPAIFHVWSGSVICVVISTVLIIVSATVVLKSLRRCGRRNRVSWTNPFGQSICTFCCVFLYLAVSPAVFLSVSFLSHLVRQAVSHPRRRRRRRITSVQPEEADSTEHQHTDPLGTTQAKNKRSKSPTDAADLRLR
jgi:hypothetical protein